MKTYFWILSVLILTAAYHAHAQQADAPVLSGIGNTPLEYQEDDTPVVLSPQLLVSDNSSEQMLLATFQFGDNYAPEVDRLVFEETESIKSVFDRNRGALYLIAPSALSGVTIQAMQNAMRNVAYKTDGDNPEDKDISVSITVTDLEGNRSAAISKTISIQPENDPPTLSSDKTNPVEIDINDEYQVFDNLQIEDPDNQLFSMAVIEIEDGFEQDKLSVEYEEEDSELEIEEEARSITISGEADADTYQRIIESVFYEHDPFFGPLEGIRKISVQLTDAGGSTSSRLSRFYIVQPFIGARFNVPPKLNDLEADTEEGNSFNFSDTFFEEGFKDINQDRMTDITIESLPRHGTLIFDGQEIDNQFVINNTLIKSNMTDRLVYVPDPLYYGDDTFLWNAKDRENFAANAAVVTIEVKSVNQSPSLNLPASVDVEEDTPTSIENISLEDADREEMKVEVEAKNGSLFLPPSVVERNLLTFSGNQQNGTGKLSFEGPVALAAFALSGLVYSPDTGFAGSDEVKVSVDDKDGGKANGTIEINILDVNDAPELLNLEGSPITYVENDDPILLTESLTVSDEEDDLIASANVSISQGYEGQDIITVEIADDINVSSTYEDGTLSLSGNATANVYQQVFRSIRFASQGDNPVAGSRTLSFTATDTLGAESEAVTRIVEVEAVNDAPVLSNLEENQLGFVANGNPVSITNELTISDPDDENLEQAMVSFIGDIYDPATDLLEFTDTENITAVWNESDGILTLQGTASIAEYQDAIRNVTYRNLSEESLEDTRTISFTVSDGEAESNKPERELVPNQPPLVSSFEKSTDEDQPILFTASDFPFQDTDGFPDGELFGIIITELPQKAVLTLENDTLTTEDLNKVIPAEDIELLQYRPLADASGADSFRWNASDGASFASSDAVAEITINALPDAPLATDISVETDEDQPLSFSSILFSEATRDPDGDALASVVIRTVPVNGRLLLNGIALPANSQLSLDELNELIYQPPENFAGEDNFTWAASDGENISSQSAGVSVIVNPVNDAPIINNFTRAVQIGDPYDFRADDFAQNYLDIEGSALAQIRIRSLPGSGTLLLNGSAVSEGAEISTAQINALTYQPGDTPGNTSVSFEWNASDGLLFAENPATISIIIGLGVTDFSISALEDEEYRFSRLQFTNNYGNPDLALQTIRIEVLPENGSLLLNNEPVQSNQEINVSDISRLVYLPDTNFSGEDTFSWNASGGSGYTEEAAQVQITVEPVNDPPLISAIDDQSLVAGSSSEPINFEVSDLETDAEELSITVFSGDESIISAEQVSISGSGTNRSLTLTVPEGSSGALTISIVVSDGEQQAETQFTVDIVPYSISIEAASELEICEGEGGSIQLSIQGGQGPYQLQTICPEGECSATYSEGVISFEPEASTTYFISLVDENGIRSNTDTVEVRVLDCSALRLNIPTAFTPNGDQVNDLWEIENIRFSNAVSVQVYNRLGRMVFSSQGYDTPWDGYYETSLLPAGTYYYVIKTEGGAQIYNGSVSILR